MANGYIGKISAVVTANTSDLSRKLQGAVGDVDKFANRIAASIERSSKNAADSLDRIFTPLQRLQRNIQAGLAGNVFRRDNVEQYIRSVQQAVSISEQLGKPLASVASQFQKLSLEVQGAFLPALNRAQSAVINLSTTLQQQGSVSERSFGQVEAVVNRTTQAIQRLTQAQQLASQSLTSNELQFGNPRLFETLSANARTTQRAAALPADALVDGSIARQIRALQQYQNAAVEAAARVESLRLEPNVNPEVLLASERRLESIIETARRAGEQVRNAVEISENIGASTQLRSTTDPSGRSIQERARDIQSAAETTERRRVAEAALRSEQEARLAVANSLLQVDQRESQLTSLEGAASTRDATGRSIQERSRDIQSEAEATERRRVAEAALRSEQEARLAVANSLLQVDQRESELISNRGSATPLGNRLAEQGRRRIEGLIGDTNIDSSLSLGPGGVVFNAQQGRDIDALASRVGAVRQQLETLPNSVRTQFIPALQQARDQLDSLKNAPGATADQIEAAAVSVKRLEAALSGATRFGQSFSDSISERTVRRQSASLEGLRSVLLSLGVTAESRAGQAFERLRIAKEAAATSGNFDAARAQLNRLEQEAIEAAAAYGGLTAAQVRAQQAAASARFGDIGRGGLDKASLGLQQLAFAVDDFFSVTGDLSQRIRAVGNNITQLGFIAGGTNGLLISLGAVLGIQAANFIAKFVFQTDKADEALKSLNASLEANQRNVEKLAQSYSRLADEIASAALSDQQRTRRDRNSRVREIAAERAAAEEEAFASLSPDVARVRGERALLNKRREESRSIEDRVRIGKEIEATLKRERELLDARGSAEASGLIARADSLGAQARDTVVNRAELRRSLGAPGDAERGEAVLAARREVEAAAARRAAIAAATLPGAATATQSEQQLGVLQAALREAESGFAALQASGVRTNRQLGQEPRPDSRPIDALEQTIEQLRERIALVSGVLAGQLATSLIDGAFAIEDSLSRTAELIDQFGGQSGALAAERDAIAARLVKIAEELGAVTSPERARELEAEQQALAEQSLALEQATKSVALFAAALDRISTELANTVANESRSAADQARRDANAAAATVDRGGGGLAAMDDYRFAARQRRRAEENARQAEDRAAEVTRQNDRARDDFERDARRGGLGADTQRLIEERDAIDAILRGDIAASDEQRREAARRRQEIDQQLGRQFEDSPEGREARIRADRADREAAARAQREEDIRRGRELGFSPAEQAGRQLADDLRALEAARDDALAPGDLAAANPQDFDAARRRIIEESFRAAAPAIFALSDQVENALVQGPSRAALQATDVSTVEGARELNRLLRGEDSARDQNLIELQKQSQSLDELVRIAREGGAQIAP